MKILTRYVLREHVGPLTFALTALTSLMLLNFISRQFGELVGKGLPWSVIGEFFGLSIPFTMALTVPMSVLVAVLYAFSRLAAENEVTALKASGVSPWRMVTPAIVGGLVWSLGLLAFNDQVLPRANHRLKVLQDDISQTKPTFLLKEQVINTVAEGRLYLKAGTIDRSGESGFMKEVVIYDLANPMHRRTTYAQSGKIALSGKDINLDLYRGQTQEVSTEHPGQLNRLFFAHDRIRVRDVVSEGLTTHDPSQSVKGDREMSICEMQDRLGVADGAYRMAQLEYKESQRAPKDGAQMPELLHPLAPKPVHGLGWAYCALMRDVLKVKEASAAELPAHHRVMTDTGTVADTARRRDTAVAGTAGSDSAAAVAAIRRPQQLRDSLRRAMAADAARMAAHAPAPPPGVASASPSLPPRFPGVRPGAATMQPVVPPVRGPSIDIASAGLAQAQMRLDIATRNRNRFEIEIHKKFSLAAACLIFAVLGAPLAVRFPRGGVGLVLGVSLLVFALYYVGLIGGEALANEGKLPPFWAMWGTNVILTLVGVVMLLRMGKDQNTGRGGDWADRIDAIKGWFGRGPRARTGASR